jgi:hypothetical protein
LKIAKDIFVGDIDGDVIHLLLPSDFCQALPDALCNTTACLPHILSSVALATPLVYGENHQFLWCFPPDFEQYSLSRARRCFLLLTNTLWNRIGPSKEQKLWYNKATARIAAVFISSPQLPKAALSFGALVT